MGRTLGEVFSKRVSSLSRAVWRRVETDSGQGLVEYALIIVFIALVAVVGLGVFGTAVNDLVGTVAAVVPP